MSSDRQDRESRQQLVQALKRSSIGIEMAVSVLVGYLMGQWLDGKFGTQPWLTVTFMLLGIAASFVALFRMAQRVSREAADEEAEDDGESGSTMGRQ